MFHVGVEFDMMRYNSVEVNVIDWNSVSVTGRTGGKTRG